MSVDLFTLKQTTFVLWRPKNTSTPPKLVVGEFSPGNPPALANSQTIDLALLPGKTDLWGIAASSCGLTEGKVYYYWFEVTDSNPERNGSQIRCTDPTAFTVDWRLYAPQLPSPYNQDDVDAASVIKFVGGNLVPCDAGGETYSAAAAAHAAKPNNQVVIYELPTSWARIGQGGNPQIGVGTFRDVLALVDPAATAANFLGVHALHVGRSHFQELGINALELLPISDSSIQREWGYAPSNYFAPDFDLGFPEGHSWPTSNTDLITLVNVCHALGIRFVIDVVMAFGTHASMENVNFDDFHINPKTATTSADEPDRWQSSRNNELRDGYGGKSWRYAKQVSGYDPISGNTGSIFPARQLMKAFLLRWMSDFRIDGLRLDSVNNIASWDFVQEFKDLARNTWSASGGAPDKFIVVGEELAIPLDLIRQNRLDGLWNEPFKRMVRYAILGHNDESEPSFEWTVRKLIDCRLLGFADGAQAVNYVGSHDVGGYRNERLYNFLQNNGIYAKEERIKLAFVCLLTAVGIPMIFAGDEFADEHDLPVSDGDKQRDGVNYDRLNDPFRRRIFDYVARLVKLRTSYDALLLNDVDIIHLDFNDGKRVVVWRRGKAGSDKQVVVVANFSDFDSGQAGSNEYRVPNWPSTPPGKRWREITQERDIPSQWVAREAIYPWEAKVYALV